MAASPLPPGAAPAPSRRRLRRDPARRVVAGVCAGLGEHLGLDPLIVRLTFVAAAAAGGIGVAVYALAWMLLPAETPGEPGPGARTRRASVETALGAGFLVLSVLLTFRAAGLWFSDAVVWPLVLVATGAALLWRQGQGGPQPAPEAQRAWAAAEPYPPAPATPDARAARNQTEDDLSARAAVVSRTGLGVALVIAAGLAFLQATGALSAARDVVLAALVVAAVLGIIFAPWVTRLVRSLTAERAQRIRSQERAEMAAHLHDSVLQTLALVQRRASEPREVATLARQQERELRAWLSGGGADADAAGIAASLEAAAEEVERAHRVRVDVVAVGDRPLDEAGQALVAAAREAMVNAAKFSGQPAIDVYAEATPERAAVFVRDRGPGFDPEQVPPDRRGVRESIVGRMERHGGRATIHRPESGGTEVELVLEDRPT